MRQRLVEVRQTFTKVAAAVPEPRQCSREPELRARLASVSKCREGRPPEVVLFSPKLVGVLLELVSKALGLRKVEIEVGVASPHVIGRLIVRQSLGRVLTDGLEHPVTV